LENPQNLKSKSLKEMCIKTLAEVISSFDVQIEATNFCMQSLLRIDSKTYPIALAELLGEYQMIDQLKGTSFIGAIVREIGKLDADSFGKDSTSSKSVGLFLESLAEHAPTAVLANVSVLLSHLDLDNYVIRNGVVQLIGKLLLFLHQKVTEEETERSEEDRNERVKSNSGKTRDSLLDLLKERVNDVSSYTRSRVLQTWKELADQNAIPVRFFAVVCNCAVERLDDKSLIVSKGAIQLLTSLLQNNPFGPQLRLQDFRSHYQSHLESMSRKEILYCKAAILFLEIFDASLDKILSHLSHGISSIMECIEFIKVANQFQIQDAEKGLKRLLPLIVSMNKEKEIRDSIVNAYAEVFLPENGNPRHSASNLVKLALSVSFSEKKCLSQIISDLARIKRIGKPVMSAIWEIFSVNQAEKVHLKRGALEIIAMVGFAHVSVISSNLKDILQEVFSPMNEQDEVLVRTAFVMMQNLGEIPDFEIEGKPVNEFVLQKVEDVLLGKIAVGPNWFGSAEQAINLLYSLHGEPSSIAISVLRRWIENLDLNSSQTISSRDLSQLFFVVGHISLKLLEQVDLVIWLFNLLFC
jgi:condensin complex subunit 1